MQLAAAQNERGARRIRRNDAVVDAKLAAEIDRGALAREKPVWTGVDHEIALVLRAHDAAQARGSLEQHERHTTARQLVLDREARDSTTNYHSAHEVLSAKC